MQPLAGVRFGDSNDGLFAELSPRPAFKRLISRRFCAANVRLWEIKSPPVILCGFCFHCSSRTKASSQPCIGYSE